MGDWELNLFMRHLLGYTLMNEYQEGRGNGRLIQTAYYEFDDRDRDGDGERQRSGLLLTPAPGVLDAGSGQWWLLE
ncbi:hypothetical protein Pmani_035747 [Petrolisthes manimaculis]|uniref:Uncharacterized protein n=1 Tax=Petrolisthes manimaculis TaxID=1843537 RepID=A0AAE1NLP5_9EUCA|nr:hypothetical protein Pmani_035747 [Petrolisthes manimaculis]